MSDMVDFCTAILGAICDFLIVAVPVRGAGCISKRIQTRISIFVGSSQLVSVVYHTSVQKGKLFCAYQTETTDLF